MIKLLAEFLGTLFICAVALLAGNFLAVALAVAAMTYALGYLSGGHFNPAISMAVWLRGQLDKQDMLRFAAAQAAGAVGAFLLFKILHGPEAGLTAAQVPWFRGLIGESIFTFLVAFTWLHVRTARQQLGNAHYGVAVGMAHFAGASSLARLSAGACNPAIGLALVLGGAVQGSMIVVYLLSGLIGGAAAAVVYRILNPND